MMEKMVKVMNSIQPNTRIAYNFTTVDENETEIEIYDVIASKKSKDFWTSEEGTEVTPIDFKEKLNEVSTKNITIRMNSAGGEVSAANAIAVAIQEAVKKDGKTIKCKIDGICASAAVQIAVSCSEVIMHKSALMMVHNPLIFVYGYYNNTETQKLINMLNGYKNSIINAYIDKTGLSKQKLSNLMDEEKWMDSNEAIELGFADSIMFDDEVEDDVINRVNNSVLNIGLEIPDKYKQVYNKAVDNPRMKKGEPKKMEIKNVADLMVAYPDLCNQIKNEAINTAKEEGIKEERERIHAIDNMKGKVSDELLNKAKYETFETAEKVALNAITEGAFVNTNVLDALEDETKNADAIKGKANEGNKEDEDEDEEKKKVEDRAKEVAENYLKQIGRIK